MCARPLPRIEIDGRPATVDLLGFTVGGGYGHFTAMQVRDRKARVVDRHLARLEEGTRALFARELDSDRVLWLVRHALGDDIRDASVRVYVYGPDAEADPSVMVTVREPASMPSTPRSLQSVSYQRPLAHIKHIGGFGQAYYGRLAARAGFDEALFVGPEGDVAEGAITNIGFIESEKVVWPDAPALHGISMQVLERELSKAGIAWSRRAVNIADVGSFDGAFLTNARGIAPVGRIDDTAIRLDAELLTTVIRMFGAAPWVRSERRRTSVPSSLRTPATVCDRHPRVVTFRHNGPLTLSQVHVTFDLAVVVSA